MGHESRLAQDPLSPRSRAFLYGESVFTTLRVEDGHVHFAAKHLERLKKSAEWLWPGSSRQVDELWELQKPVGKTGVWRLTLFAMQYDRQILLSETPHLELDSAWSEGLPSTADFSAVSVVCAARSPEWPSYLKSGDYLARLVASRHLRAPAIPLFLVDGKVAEFLHANVFLWTGDKFLTPPAGPDVLDGVGRGRLIELLQRLGVGLEETPITREDLATAQSIWAVNALRGVVELAAIDSRPLTGHALRNQIQALFFSRS